MIHLVQDRVQ